LPLASKQRMRHPGASAARASGRAEQLAGEARKLGRWACTWYAIAAPELNETGACVAGICVVADIETAAISNDFNG
jgi:hypothetical protein